MNVRMIQPEEWLRTEELFALAFEIPMKRQENAEPDQALHWAAFDADGEMMSTLTVSDFDIAFDGHTCRMGGIGGVATLPQYRRRGGIRGCFEAFLPELYRREYDFSYLYPFSTCFYRQFGYENCVQKQQICIDLRLLKAEIPGGTYRLSEPKRDLTSAVKIVDSTWEEAYNFAVRHDDKYYAWVRRLDPAAGHEFCYVWFRENGEPGAYVTYRSEKQPDGWNLICSRFRFLDREGYRALLALLKTMASDHPFAKFQLPDSTAMRYLMPEWSLGAASWSIVPAGMVRVIRVQEVLRKAAYHGSGRAVVQVCDPQIKENNHSYMVRFENGKAVSVEITLDEADVRCTIPAFSALISGTCDLADAVQWMDGVELLRDNPALYRIFYRKPMFLTDYF